ncbi:MAG: IS1595 family transposase [Acidobacteria bacterium]|nr:IS1595 family transposase [Acidobacteriota bacterium]
MPQTKNINLLELNTAFDTQEECLAYLEKLRWPDGAECPRCKGKKVSRIVRRAQYDCDSCRYQFSVTSGTIFHDSHLPLPKWFLAIYLMLESRKGISSNQMRRMLKVAPKTAWYLTHRIRKAMEEANPRKLDGTVEVDETYIGGRYDKRRKRGPWEKQAVMGMIERDGKFEAQTIPTPSARTLVGIIRERIEPSATVFSDEYPAYKSVAKSHKRHDAVNHTAEEWVRGEVHTNNIESAWSLFNRSIVGAFHKISTKHMNAYLNEFEWRFNNRSNPYLFRDTIQKLITADKLEYRELIA